LGGQVIARQLAESIHVYPGKGASFFHGHGANTQLHWQDFWRLAAEVCTKGSMEEVCASAVRMFGDFNKVLDSCVQCRLQVVNAL
jgi:heme oxygenase